MQKSWKYFEYVKKFATKNYRLCPGHTLVAWDKEMADPIWVKDTADKDHHSRTSSKKSTSLVQFAIDSPSIFRTRRTFEKMSNATNRIIAWYERTMSCPVSFIALSDHMSLDIPLKSFSQRNFEKF